MQGCVDPSLLPPLGAISLSSIKRLMFLYLSIRYIDSVVMYKDHGHLCFFMKVSCVSGIEDV